MRLKFFGYTGHRFNVWASDRNEGLRYVVDLIPPTESANIPDTTDGKKCKIIPWIFKNEETLAMRNDCEMGDKSEIEINIFKKYL